MLTLSVDQPDWAEAIAAIEADDATKLRHVVDAIGPEVIAYLRSLTSEMRPPARVPGTSVVTGPRRAHPGHWADVTSVLAASYDFDVAGTPRSVTLTLRNTAEYAIHLENRFGYWVLSGVADPGGPVEQSLRRAVARFAPEWEVRRG